jgi:hypothetical protein
VLIGSIRESVLVYGAVFYKESNECMLGLHVLFAWLAFGKLHLNVEELLPPVTAVTQMMCCERLVPFDSRSSNFILYALMDNNN